MKQPHKLQKYKEILIILNHFAFFVSKNGSPKAAKSVRPIQTKYIVPKYAVLELFRRTFNG